MKCCSDGDKLISDSGVRESEYEAPFPPSPEKATRMPLSLPLPLLPRLSRLRASWEVSVPAGGSGSSSVVSFDQH